jgi:uncharacterized protein YycO
MIRISVISSIVAFFVSILQAANVEDGDIVFQRSQSRQSDAIAAATKSEHTHVGIVFFSDGKPYVYEAVQPVKRTPFDEWVRRGVGSKYEVKRLRDRDGVDFSAVHEQARSFLGKDYDLEFRWTDERIYCSELVWKVYKRATELEVGALKRLRDFDLSSQVVRQKLQERYGRAIPYNMTVISPACIFASDLLISIPTNP